MFNKLEHPPWCYDSTCVIGQSKTRDLWTIRGLNITLDSRNYQRRLPQSPAEPLRDRGRPHSTHYRRWLKDKDYLWSWKADMTTQICPLPALPPPLLWKAQLALNPPLTIPFPPLKSLPNSPYHPESTTLEQSIPLFSFETFGHCQIPWLENRN